MSIVSTFFPHKFRPNYLLIFTFLYKRILQCFSSIIHSYYIEMFWNKYDVNYLSDGRVQRTWNLRKWYLPHGSIFLHTTQLRVLLYTRTIWIIITLIYLLKYIQLNYPILLFVCLFMRSLACFFFQFYAVGFNHIHNSIIHLLSNVWNEMDLKLEINRQANGIICFCMQLLLMWLYCLQTNLRVTINKTFDLNSICNIWCVWLL